MSKALFLILNDTRRINSIYDIFYENECGATTIDSVGLGKTLLTKDIEVPIFAGISMGQFLSLLMGLFGLVMLIRNNYIPQKK